MVQHLSIRVPWKDNGYSGLICDKPCYNNSCLRLVNISTNKNDELETQLAGCPIKGHEEEIPCLSEGGVFMSDATHKKITVHPYKNSNPDTHGHFKETELIYPPFSLPARPFAWTMLKRGNDKDDQNIRRLSDLYNIDYEPSREPQLAFNTNWIQDSRNQRAIFKTFYENVIPKKSLVVAYAKQVPFIDDSKRVVMAIGLVDSITEPPDHNCTEDGELRSILWETMIGHTIRKDRKNGFVFPYAEMMEYAKENPDFDIRTVTVFAEDDYFEEFSYATEHLSYDATINVLLQSIKAINIIKNCIPGNWDDCIEWCNIQLNEVWHDRGAYPGLGAMLCASGFKFGMLIANEIKIQYNEKDNFEDFARRVLETPSKYLPIHLVESIKKPEQNTFLSLPEIRLSLFWLLSRLSINKEQAQTLYHNENRQKNNIFCADREIIENPYALFEKTRGCKTDYAISVKKVDMAVFPPAFIRKIYPLSGPSEINSENDSRRIRAIVVSLLEYYALNGHTVYPQINLCIDMNNLAIEPACVVSGDILNAIKTFLLDEVEIIECDNGSNAYQLRRLYDFDEIIRKSITKRINAQRHQVDENWAQIIKNDPEFQKAKITEMEKRARIEKTAILKELAEARLSVLIGGAGTGKTTLLSLLCKSPQIRDGGVLLLAPTGKARVRMSQAMNSRGVIADAKTVAQFLIQNGRFNYNTMQYQLSNVDATNVPLTVIIDECSMLTEEMMGALLQALKRAQRIIFVGDPNQLPPIGAGRPFVDLVNFLKKDISQFPKVGKSYGELTVTRRQQNENGKERVDTILAEWFTDADIELNDQIFIDLQSNTCGDEIEFKHWETAEDLEQKIIETIVSETPMNNELDIYGFDISLGGTLNGEWMNFGTLPHLIESWQVLSAYRNDASCGTATINRYIHQRYRNNTPSKFKKRSTKHLLGTDGIIFGDKVINIRNNKKDGYPEANCQNFVANGEVGIVERIWQKPKDKKNTHQIKFSSQPSHNYNFPSYASDEAASDLELAYALTIHKAQGSEFGTVILVLSEPSRLLSKEMLYTAITRQKKKLVILYNKDAYYLRGYSSKEQSDIARRFTCLFNKPNIVEFKQKYYEASLIHKTEKGELVRSKSEVIVANLLHTSGIAYEYEKPLILNNGNVRIPDFTIDDAESGTLFYWEHCGMMSNEEYKKRWEDKKREFELNGIIEGVNLIVSYDESDGSINSQAIKALITKYL